MKRLLILAALALIASACRIDATVGIDLTRPGDAGDLTVTLETDEEFEELFAITDRDFESLLAGRGSATGLTFRVVEGDGTTIYSTSAEGLSYEAIENVLSRLAPGLGPLTIMGKDDTVEIDAELNSLQDLEDVAPFFVDFDPTQFRDNVSASLVITAPGDVTASSADSISGNNYTWVLSLSEHPTRVIVRSDLVTSNSSDFPWPLAILGSVAVLAITFLLAIRSGLTRYTKEEEPAALRTIQSPAPTPPEDQGPPATPPEDQGPPSIPPEDQPVAPADPAAS